MKKQILFSDKNIPESLLIGKGTFTVLECKDQSVYQKVEQVYRGGIFHLQKDGRFYVKVNTATLKQLKSHIE